MANTFLVPSVMAREGTRLLRANLAASRMFSRRFQPEFTGVTKVGESVRVRRRTPGTVDDYAGSTITIRDITESPITIAIEKHYDCSIRITARERAMSLQEFSSQVMEPQMVAMAQQVDSYVSGKLKDFAYCAGASETAPGTIPSSPADFAQVDKTLNDLLIPVAPRGGIVSTEIKSALLQQSQLTKVNESGDSDALRRAMIGELMGFDLMMSQNVATATFTSGTMTSCLVNSASLAAGATSIPFDGANGATVTLKAGDIITIGTYGKYVVAADVTASSSAGTITIKEPLWFAVPDNTAITVYDGGGNTRQHHGAVFHPDALSLVVIPLEAPISAPAEQFFDPESNLGMRAVFDYDRDRKADVLSLDILVGAMVVDGRLGAQLIKNI